MPHDDDTQLQRQLVDLQCRFMDVELLVSELNEVVAELSDQVTRGERERRALSRRVGELELASDSGGGDGL